MNDDTFSRNEERMVLFHRSNDHDTSRESASGFANVVGARLANDALSESRDAIESAKRRGCIIDFYTMDDSLDIANAIRESGLSEITVIADLVKLNNRHEREIAALRSDLADLRAAQFADPTGAHPYRSTTPAKAPSRPVVTSGAPERVEGRSESDRPVNGQRGGLLWSAALLGGMATTMYGAWTMDHAVGLPAMGATFLVAVFAAIHRPEYGR